MVCKAQKTLNLPNLDEETVRARASDKLFAPRDVDDVQLVYKDKEGKVLSTKEAYRMLCYQFHGKAPGKNKVGKYP